MEFSTTMAVPFWCVFLSILFTIVIDARHIEPRSDDPAALTDIVEQLVAVVSELKASKAAMQTEIIALKNRVASMKCESGTQRFNPHAQIELSGRTRTDTHHVTFSPSFAAPPQISTGIVYLDSDNTASADRIRVTVRNVAATGFDIDVMEWIDTHNFEVDVSWMACLVG